MSIRRSLGITAVTRLAVVVLSFATVVIVSRLLTPEEIGIFSVTVSIVTLGHVFRDFGVAQYLIQAPEITRQRKRAAFTVTLAFSWGIAALLSLLQPLIIDFYADERVGHVLWLLVVNFVILPFGAPLRTLLQRDMQFDKLAVVTLANHATQSIVTVGSAWFGASYMSMAWGSIAGNLANVIVLLAISPHGALDWPTRHGLREVLRFGSKASTASLAGAAGDTAPDLILGRTLGFADVAFYSRARGLIGMALDQVMHVVRSVYTPAYAKGVREGHSAAAMYTQTLGLLLGLTVPVVGVLAVLAPTLITWLFGEAWGRSGPLGTMFCLFALLTAPFTLAGPSLVAAGHVGAMMRVRLAVEGTRVLALLSSLWWPLEYVVATLGLVYGVEALLSMQALRRHIGLRAGMLLRAIARSYALGLCAAVPSLLLMVLVPRLWADQAAWAVLGMAAAAGTAGWGAGLVALKHPLWPEVRAVAQRLAARVGRRAPP